MSKLTSKRSIRTFYCFRLTPRARFLFSSYKKYYFLNKNQVLFYCMINKRFFIHHHPYVLWACLFTATPNHVFITCFCCYFFIFFISFVISLFLLLFLYFHCCLFISSDLSPLPALRSDHFISWHRKPR